ncbi:hypothetical protein HZP67_09865 [Elizabethkingia anophelis]|nr:hypothetical protein [Elizabethkingia anophelis]MCT4148147.1 hypothetical protein [Elizabethkingia anophelis]
MEGKAKETFEKWYLEKSRLHMGVDNPYYDEMLLLSFKNTEDIIKNAYYIEWLDSVGIYVDIEFLRKNVKDEALFVSGTTDELNGFQALGVEYKSRQSATEAAIKKAVEIYNEKYKEQ